MSRFFSKPDSRVVLLLLVSLLCALLCTCVFAPLEISTVTNILYKDSPIPALFYYARKLFEIIHILLLFAIVSFAEYFFYNDRVKRITPSLCAVLIVIIKWTFNFIATAVFEGISNPGAEIAVTVIYALLDVALLAVIYISAHFICSKHYSHAAELQKAQRRLGQSDFNERRTVYPFSSLLPKKNPVTLPVFIGMSVYTASLVVSRIIYDISFGFSGEVSDIVDIIFGYTSDLLTGIIGYAFCYFLLIFLFSSEERE